MAALPHEAPLLSVLRFFSVLVIPAFWLWFICDNFQKPVSVSEEEWEKDTWHLRRCYCWGGEKTCRAGPMGRASNCIETHGAQFVDFKMGVSLALRDCPSAERKVGVI